MSTADLAAAGALYAEIARSAAAVAEACPRTSPRPRRAPVSGLKLTLWEKARIVALEARGVKRADAGIEHQPDIDRRVERVREQARRRAARGK
ncbi:DUF6257 family protein [Streptomyces sp. RLB1-33]|nr:DUF6257 family protein [Streptomyces sp. RLB1-33]QIY74893.1 hypothetical protein HEP84_43365 [Streptomyces sp. RLB1-33]